jgi:hypothetical protein
MLKTQPFLDTDCEPDGATPNDSNGPDDLDKNDLVDDWKNANEEVDDARDEKPPYDDQFEGGDGMSEDGAAGDGIEADLESIGSRGLAGSV